MHGRFPYDTLKLLKLLLITVKAWFSLSQRGKCENLRLEVERKIFHFLIFSIFICANSKCICTALWTYLNKIKFSSLWIMKQWKIHVYFLLIISIKWTATRERIRLESAETGGNDSNIIQCNSEDRTSRGVTHHSTLSGGVRDPSLGIRITAELALLCFP